MTKISSFNVTYDAGSDVLYLSKRSEPAARSREDAHGIVWRYDRSGDLIGATIVDFHEFWRDKSEDLAAALSKRFDLPAPQMRVVVDRALELKD